MSGRRRRSEFLWDRKEEAVPQNEAKEFDLSFHGGGSPKWSNLEANDELMSDDFSMKPSREPMHGNENMSTDNDRRRMKMDPAFDGWESQYNSRTADNVQSYRSVDRGVSGLGNVSRARDRSRSRSLSPHRSRGRDRDRDHNRGSTRGLARSRSRSRGRDQGRGRSPSRGGANRIDHDSTEKWSGRPEYLGGSRDRSSTDNPQSKGSDGYRKDTARNEESRDYYRNNRSGYDDHRRQSNQSIKHPCRFFIMGKCNRNNCNFSHDPAMSEGDGRLHDNIHDRNSGFSDFPNPKPDSDDKNKSWNDPPWNNLESGGFNEMSRDIDHRSNQESQPIRDSSQLYNSDGHNIVSGETNPNHYSYGERFNQDVHHNSSQLPSNLNANGSNLQLNGSAHRMFLHMDLQNQTEIQNKESGKPLESFKNKNPELSEIANAEPVPQISQNLNLDNALGSLYSLPNSASFDAPVGAMVVNEPVAMNLPESQMSLEPVETLDVNENKIVEKSKGEEQNMNPEKSEAQEKVEEGNLGNDEKAMRQFKVALVEFVKEILKPTWKEGKMSREVYKTIVKKVVEKVTSTIQGVQIPRTQEKIDQYLAFSKSKITKLVEAYVGRHLKAK